MLDDDDDDDDDDNDNDNDNMHLGPLRGIGLSIKFRVRAAAVRMVLLCGSGAWVLTAGVRRLSAFKHCYPLGSGVIWWENFVIQNLRIGPLEQSRPR